MRLVANGQFYPCLVRETDGWHARWRAIGVENPWVDEIVRTSSLTRLTEDAEDQFHVTLHDAWMMALRSRTGLVRGDETECRRLAATLEEWSRAAGEDRSARAEICFHLVARDEQLRLTCVAPRTRRGLTALGQAVSLWSPLVGLRAGKPRSHELVLDLTAAEAGDFVRRSAAVLQAAGYQVDGLPQVAEISAAAEIESDKDASAPPHVKLTVRVAGEPVTAADVRFLLDQGSTLVFFRNRWIEVDRNLLRQALRALEKGLEKKANVLTFAMGLGCVDGFEITSLKLHGWVRGLVNELRSRGALDLKTPVTSPSFVGRLRDYQEEGVRWFQFMTSHGFGALLADEMGLGKTIQSIAWICLGRAARKTPVLIVAPLTLLSNWRHEFSVFAPSLRVYTHQGDRRHLASGFKQEIAATDVVLTSYNLLVRDYSIFSEVAWDALILDEAQIAKNPATQVARAIRALSPRHRIALTGTPIENSPMDLWSLEDFLNPSFLGEAKDFCNRFAKPLANHPESAVGKRLSHALEPFILRRLKTDKRIAAELGEKREIREFCELTPAARRAYEEALAEYRVTAHTPGDAFALLTQLKLICDGEGKFEHLCNLLEQIFSAGESALLFTQYAKVGKWLQEKLMERFARKFPFLHGELSAEARTRLVDEFQSSARPMVFILSLKAGGFGLNLTKATHVLHFDRWWNPAVEAQATDRAHRIGQKKTVFVHVMITSGTVEERVDEILQQKTTLKDLIANGEAFWKAVSLE